MRHPLHVAVPVSVPAGAAPPAGALPVTGAARHRRPRTSPARTVLAVLARVPPPRRLAAGLGLASVLAASALTTAVDPAAPVAPDRVPARQSSTFAQVSGE
ncbi:hypothetical protein ACFWCB_21155 [Streptomyces sp. NPDC060048]|uniref:hypothetical protein n=1 Tax=unclassified Streptomyces TaxID=2593676 RepID=UPI003699171F